jgi:GntR family transcriptional regulator of arabinose operon
VDESTHKYEILMDFLRSEIEGGRIAPGGRIPSENALAASFSISRFTVRRAVELLTNEGLLEKRRGSGTFVRAAAGKRGGVIGIVTTYLDDYIFPSIIKGLEDVLTRAGCTMSLGITGNETEREAACLRSMLAQNVDGLIIEGTGSALPGHNLGLLRAFEERNIPVVFINGNYADFDSSYVMMDDEGSGRMAVEHLIKNGHTRLGGIFKADDIQGHKRHKGFAAGCGAADAADGSAVLWYTTADLSDLFSPRNDAVFMERFAACTGIVCYNDQIAVRAIETLARCGRAVPRDCSLIGFDNSDLCDVSAVRLTSVTHARWEMGEAAAEAMLSLLAGGGPVKLLLPSRLVGRDSVRNLSK